MNYLLISIAVTLFSIQFFCNQRYQQLMGNTLNATLLFNFCGNIVVTVLMLIITAFRVSVTPFSLLIATLRAISGMGMMFFSMKALSVTNLSVYSVFSMLGGMLLPFLLGVIFYSEAVTVSKVVCCVLIVVSVLLTCRPGQNGKRALVYYLAVFVLNGMAAVLSKIHQSSTLPHTGSGNLMMLTGCASVLISGICLLARTHRIPVLNAKSLFFSTGAGALNGIANWLLLIALVELPASVQYPLVTGGVMVCTTLISVLRKEHLTVNEYIAAAIAFAASVAMAL